VGQAIATVIVRAAVASAGVVAIAGTVSAAIPAMSAVVRTQLPLCAQPAKKLFEIAIANGRVTGVDATLRVQEGDEVELRWSSDRPLSLHLHGYDIETNVSRQVPSVMSFNARLAGRFPVSEHREGARERTILYIEVHP
jgi:FtsP/CotA-like multicopper oxidase with cupredoxin domain